MSRSLHIVCMDCREHLWVGQRDYIYTAESNTMEAFKQFLMKHRTTYAPRTKGEEYHELLFLYEPYNATIEDFYDHKWKEWDAYKFAPPKPLKQDRSE